MYARFIILRISSINTITSYNYKNTENYYRIMYRKLYKMDLSRNSLSLHENYELTKL